jgi:hypothetical protein
VDREKLQVLLKKSREKYLAGKGGGLFLFEERPVVMARENDEVVYNGKTVNYVLLVRALMKASVTGEGTERDRTFSVKVYAKENGDFVLSFLDGNTGSQGAIGLSPFKRIALFEAANRLKDTVPNFTEFFPTTDGGEVKLLRLKERVVFPYGVSYVEIPLAERIMLKNSITHFLETGEMRPFLATLVKTGNKDGQPFVSLGIEDYIIPVDTDVAIRLLALI